MLKLSVCCSRRKKRTLPVFLFITWEIANAFSKMKVQFDSGNIQMNQVAEIHCIYVLHREMINMPAVHREMINMPVI